MQRTDINEMPTIIAWLEGTRPRDVTAALRRQALSSRPESVLWKVAVERQQREAQQALGRIGGLRLSSDASFNDRG